MIRPDCAKVSAQFYSNSKGLSQSTRFTSLGAVLKQCSLKAIAFQLNRYRNDLSLATVAFLL